MHFLLPLLLLAVSAPKTASFGDFDKKARDGQHLNVVFLGASLTWGSNASDPNKTSYRGEIAKRMEAMYHDAHLSFHDAAIGGTGSQLGVFRVDRDVLAHNPDLVFLDFSANDDIYSSDEQKNASYEAIVRRLIEEAHVPVVQVIFPFKWDIDRKKLSGMKRRDVHLAISKAYNTAVGDAVELAIDRIDKGETTLATLWEFDGVHPGDRGYELFADAAWNAFTRAVASKIVCQAPEKSLYGDAYSKAVRFPLKNLTPLPAGWHEGKPNVQAAYFDFTMSRWLDSVVIASMPKAEAGKPADEVPQRFVAKITGSMLMILGETTPTSGKYRVWIDGKAATHQPDKKAPPTDIFDVGYLAQRIKGNGHSAQLIATGLDPAIVHMIEVEPILEPGQELRIESICVAGPVAAVAKAFH